MEAEIQATFEHCGSFNSKLKDTLTSLLNANNDRKAEIDSLRSDHDALQQAHDAFQGRNSIDTFLGPESGTQHLAQVMFGFLRYI